MDRVAFGLKSELDGTVDTDDGPVPIFLGGIIRAGDKDFDLARELKRGDGRIVVDVDDVVTVNALDELDALERVDAPPSEDELTVDELKSRLKALDQPVSGTKAELVARLAEAQAAHDAAEATLAGDTDNTDGQEA